MNYEDLTKEDFLFIKEKIFEFAGIHLTEKKRDLVRSRLQSFLRKSSVKSVEELKIKLKESDPIVIQEFVNLLTTNKTNFFREPNHFEFLTEELIPYWQKVKKKEIKIWCCASSTGEEPYTIAMVLSAHLPSTLPFKILATDIDTQVLKKAQNGVYSKEKISEIPERYHSLLKTGAKNAKDWFKVRDELHSRITFQKHNLMDATYPGDEIFDLIFCRNVLIYFEKKSIRTLMEKLNRSLKSDGYLFTGHSESIQNALHVFKPIQPAIYKKVSL